MARNGEMLLGVIGGLFALLGSFVGIALAKGINVIYAVVGSQLAPLSVEFLVVAAACGVVGLFGALWVQNNPKEGGGLMLLSAIFGMVFGGLLFLLGAICLVVAGVAALLRSESKRG